MSSVSPKAAYISSFPSCFSLPLAHVPSSHHVPPSPSGVVQCDIKGTRDERHLAPWHLWALRLTWHKKLFLGAGVRETDTSQAAVKQPHPKQSKITKVYRNIASVQCWLQRKWKNGSLLATVYWLRFLFGLHRKWEARLAGDQTASCLVFEN